MTGEPLFENFNLTPGPKKALSIAPDGTREKYSCYFFFVKSVFLPLFFGSGN
jgi:hypothetical protein